MNGFVAMKGYFRRYLLQRFVLPKRRKSVLMRYALSNPIKSRYEKTRRYFFRPSLNLNDWGLRWLDAGAFVYFTFHLFLSFMIRCATY